MTEADALVQIKNAFQLVQVDLPSDSDLDSAYTQYNTLRMSGHTKAQIVRLWLDGQFMTSMQVATMANAMDNLEKGIPIQDPNERPSLQESYDAVLGPMVSSIPWGKIVLVGLAYAFVTQGLPRLLKK